MTFCHFVNLSPDGAGVSRGVGEVVLPVSRRAGCRKGRAGSPLLGATVEAACQTSPYGSAEGFPSFSLFSSSRWAVRTRLSVSGVICR